MEVIDQQSREEIVNNEHLNLLSLFYFIFGGLSLLGAFILFIYSVILGVLFSSGPIRESMNESGEEAGMVIGVVTSVFVVLFIIVLTIGVLQVLSGFKLRKRTNRIFSIVMGILVLLSFPLGTALGIFTIIVLSRPSVIEMYRKSEEALEEEKFGIRRL